MKLRTKYSMYILFLISEVLIKTHSNYSNLHASYYNELKSSVSSAGI